MTNEKKLIQNCHEEELRFFHRVQKFSYFISFDKETHLITAVSDNLLDFLELDRLRVFEQKVGGILSKNSLEELITTIEDYEDGTETNLLPLVFKNQKKTYDCIVFHENGDIYLEIEKFNLSKSLSRHLFFDMFHNSSMTVEDETDIYSIADSLSRNLKAALGVERVMVYKFDESDNGEVIGEACKKGLEPYLGLHYPASDIPAQARALYLKNRSRIIYDVYEDTVKIITQDDNKKINLARSSCRTVSHVHIQYLKNMGVRSSFSISLIHNDKLWGLICCHHSEPFFLPYRTRLLLESMGGLMMARISQYENKLLREAEQSASNLTLSIIQDLTSFDATTISFDDSIINTILKNKESEVLNLLDATSFHLKLDEMNVSIGGKIPERVVKKIRSILSQKKEEVLISQNIFEDYPELKEDGDTCLGILALNFNSLSEENTIVWARPEYQKQIRWAGKDEKSEVADGDIIRLMPRSSFEEFIELKKDKSRAWSEKDLVGARQFYILMNKIILTLWKKSQLRVNKMLELDRAKDSFIGLVSHELRTPLNNMLGWLQILKSEKGISEIMQEGLDVLSLNANNQMTVVNDLIDFSRTQTGKLKVELSPINIVSLVNEVIKSITPTASVKDIELKINVRDPSIIINGDKERLSQIIWNLLHNAIKFSPKNSRITIDLLKVNSDLNLSISDQGVGIEAKDLNTIFNRFHQLDSGLDRKHNGLGLGLSMVKVLTELHAGKVTAFSEGKNKGTKFELIFPLASTTEAIKFENSEALNVTLPLHGVKILLLEDNIDSSRFLKLAINQAGGEVEIFNHASKALESIELGKKYDVILSDVGLPEISGYEFMKLLRKKLNCAIPSIALTAHIQPKDVKEALDSGFSAHVEKPVELSRLTNEIKKFAGVK